MKSHQRIYEALLTGVPYGFFKFLTGWYLIQFQVHIVGYPLMVMGVIDIVLNLVGVFRPAPFPLCTLVVLGRTLPHTSRKKADEFALALDTLASFALVSSMIWFGAIGYVASTFGRLWDACVILNIVSVGVARVYASFRV